MARMEVIRDASRRVCHGLVVIHHRLSHTYEVNMKLDTGCGGGTHVLLHDVFFYKAFASSDCENV